MIMKAQFRMTNVEWRARASMLQLVIRHSSFVIR